MNLKGLLKRFKPQPKYETAEDYRPLVTELFESFEPNTEFIEGFVDTVLTHIAKYELVPCKANKLDIVHIAIVFASTIDVNIPLKGKETLELSFWWNNHPNSRSFWVTSQVRNTSTHNSSFTKLVERETLREDHYERLLQWWRKYKKREVDA